MLGFKKLLLREKLLEGTTNIDHWKVDGKKVDEEENNLKEFTEDDIKDRLGGQKMNLRFLLKDYFDAVNLNLRDIHVFIVSTSTGKCLPTFYLSNKKYPLTNLIYLLALEPNWNDASSIYNWIQQFTLAPWPKPSMSFHLCHLPNNVFLSSSD